MKIYYELFDDLRTNSEYRVTTVLTLDKNKKTWALYWNYAAMYADSRATDFLEIEEEIAIGLLKASHISNVEVVKE